jgi:hypothetical protein
VPKSEFEKTKPIVLDQCSAFRGLRQRWKMQFEKTKPIFEKEEWA